MARGIDGLVRPVLAGGLLAAALTLSCATPASAEWLDAEHRLTSGDGGQQWPRLSNSLLVYSDHTNERTSGDVTVFDIRARDLRTGRDQLLTPDHTATGRAAVSGSWVVWPDAGDGAEAGIRYADLATGESRLLDTHPGDDVAISGNRICYSWHNRVWVDDLRTGGEKVVSSASSPAGECDISGSVVVWQEQHDGSTDVRALDLASGVRTTVTNDPAEASMPRTDGHVVVWQDDRAGADNTDIYAYDLARGTETRVTEAPGRQWLPAVADGRVVWMDERLGHGNTEVYFRDLASGVEGRVSDDDGWSGNPAISGAVIVYEDVRSAGHNLYSRTIAPPSLTAAVEADPADGRPVLAGRLTTSDGVPLVAADLQLETSADGVHWQSADSATAAGDGSYSFAAGDAGPWLRVRFAGSQDYAPVVSAPVRLDAPAPTPSGSPR